MADPPHPLQRLRRRTALVIFRHDTGAARAFDIGLLVLIVVSVIAVMLESIDSVASKHGTALRTVEWIVTILFTVEYFLRLLSLGRPLNYALSFYGLVDLLSILPTYLGLFVPHAQSLTVIRALRLLRVFRVLKLMSYTGEAGVLAAGLRASRRKIIVFIFSVAMIVLIVGAMMYVIEGPVHGFSSIPVSCYWAVVTLTTVGYGDIAPRTPLGQSLASALMLMGYGIIAVPTGIVTAELVNADRNRRRRLCPACHTADHEPTAKFCRDCGASLKSPQR